MATMEEAQAIHDHVSAAIGKAVGLWGRDFEIRLAQEECAELIAAINRFARDRVDIDRVREEIADVILCCGALRLLFGCADVDRAVVRKLERLEGRIAEALAQREASS